MQKIIGIMFLTMKATILDIQGLIQGWINEALRNEFE